MKTLITVFLAFFAFVPITHAFTDVPENHPYYEAILWGREAGIVEGYSDGSFGPDNTINRAEFSKIFAELPSDVFTHVNVETPERDDVFADCMTVPFADVGSQSWFFEPVRRLYCGSVIDGYPDGTFKPGNTINYAEVAKIVFGVQSSQNTYLYTIEEIIATFHIDDTDPWYEPYMLTLQHVKPDSISNVNSVAAQHLVTRGEMLHILYKKHVGAKRKQEYRFPIFFYTQEELSSGSTTPSYVADRVFLEDTDEPENTAREAVKSLFSGPTPAEKEQGAIGFVELTEDVKILVGSQSDNREFTYIRFYLNPSAKELFSEQKLQQLEGAIYALVESFPYENIEITYESPFGS